MNTIALRHQCKTALALVLTASVLAFVGMTPASADNGNGNGYSHNNGYNNNGNWHNNGNAHANQYYHQGHYYPYAYHNNHRGYWNQNSSGVRFFIVL